MAKLDISHKFNSKELILFALPSIVMMVFQSLYTITDSAFVSGLISTDALSSINLVWPIIGLCYALSVMFGIGGASIVSKILGEGHKDLACRYFTTFYLINVVVTLIYTFICLNQMEKLLMFVGLDENTYLYGKAYLSIMSALAICTTSQNYFQPFFISASKPRLGLSLIVSAGLFNVAFDYILIEVIPLGISGAAIATVLGQSIPTIGGLIFFSKKSSNIHFKKPVFNIKTIFRGLSNGSGEMIVSLSNSVVTFLFNVVMLNLGGSDAVAGICTLQYMHFFFTSIFQGYSLGVQPVMSYNYGAKRVSILKNIYKISLKFLVTSGLVMTLLCFILSKPIAFIYAPTNEIVYNYISIGLKIYCVGVVFSSINIYHIGVFQSLNNGHLAAIISFTRSFILLIIGTFGLSYLFDVYGVFMALPFSEIMSIISIIYFKKYINQIINNLY